MENLVTIIYEDEDVVVINKPAGIKSHPDGYGSEATISDWFASKYPQSVEVGEPLVLARGELIRRPGIVHRLDKDTSGVMILAKNQTTFSFLKGQFKNHQVQKVYWLIVSGQIKKTDRQIINLPIGRSNQDSRRRLASLQAKGKLRPAKTSFKVLQNFANCALVEARPETGRTHQLRAHFKAIQHPIICDQIYFPRGFCVPGLNRQALHAKSLTLILPGGKPQSFEAGLPADFQAALDHLQTA